jgi:hypothetical protein
MRTGGTIYCRIPPGGTGADGRRSTARSRGAASVSGRYFASKWSQATIGPGGSFGDVGPVGMSGMMGIGDSGGPPGACSGAGAGGGASGGVFGGIGMYVSAMFRLNADWLAWMQAIMSIPLSPRKV